MNTIIWHNPRCSKSRETLALLENGDETPTVVLYKETPPSVSEIKRALALLQMSADQLIRKGEPKYKDLKLAEADDATLIIAMAEHPELIERPVVFANGKAALGRPPQSVLAII